MRRAERRGDVRRDLRARVRRRREDLLQPLQRGVRPLPPTNPAATTHPAPAHPVCHSSSSDGPAPSDRPFPATHAAPYPPPPHPRPLAPLCPQGPMPARRNRGRVRQARLDTPAARRRARLCRRGLHLRHAPSRRRALPPPARTRRAPSQGSIAAVPNAALTGIGSGASWGVGPRWGGASLACTCWLSARRHAPRGRPRVAASPCR